MEPSAISLSPQSTQTRDGRRSRVLRGEPHADADRQALPERSCRDVHPRNQRSRMSFEDAPELAVCQQFIVADGSGPRAESRSRASRHALREDEPVVGRALRVVEVVPEMVRHHTAIRSAADMPDVGCPDFATAAGRIESTRNCWPSSRSSFASIPGHSRSQASSRAGGVRSSGEGGDRIRPPGRSPA